MRVPGAIGEVGDLRVITDAREMILACYANPITAILYLRVPLPDWPNAAANEAHYFGPIVDHT